MTSVLLALVASPAMACGGFFCDNNAPIDQSAERIVFAVDEPAGEVTMHVQVVYSGASDHFAWILPVSGVPDLFVSSDTLFTTLAFMTEPQFYLDYTNTNGCESWWPPTAEYDVSDSDGTNGGVTVVSQQAVGPYDTVVLQADNTAALLQWLQDEGYDLPDELDPALQPYVADNQYFVALKLAAGNDVGDLTPLGLRYAGTQPAIPIQLTSIAATPDMRLEAYVLGDARAVPDNYLHVTINEAAIDWFNGGGNYDDVITLAADEAGGHAFATDFSGSTAPFRGLLWSEGRFDLASLRAISDPVAYVDALIGQGFPGSAAMLDFLLTNVPLPQAAIDAGVDPQSFYNCMSCYPEYTSAIVFDANAATDALDAKIVEPLRQADQLFQSFDHLSRMTSSLDAIEMDVDPIFTFNADLPQEISNIHRATVEMDCGVSSNWDSAERTLILSDGRTVRLPSVNWLNEHGMTELEYMADLTTPAAILIEDYSSSGLGTLIGDWRADAAAMFLGFGGNGCGCAAGRPAWSLPVGLLSVALLRRRRA